MAALVLLLLATAAGAHLGDLERTGPGDLFTLLGDECGPSQCSEHGAGPSEGAPRLGECACACPLRAPLFREDRELCVDDLSECSLATFGTGVGVQKIPFVYLPLKGQIIHPSKEITFQDVKTPICAVSGAQFLTRKGFLDLRNTLDADVPFSLFRDEGRTFLQWSGEDDVRERMTGRVMVVRLLCRDVATPPASPLDLRGVFTPCVAFRVQGTPSRQINNVTEVLFTPNAQTSEATNNSGLSVAEYVAIGISSLLLGLVYVASVFLYLHIRKKRNAASSEGSTKRLKGLKNKDGSTITERDIVRINNERLQALPSPIGQNDGVVKKNPLLNIGRQYYDSKTSYPSDSGSLVSDCEDLADSSALSEENLFHDQTTSAVVHRNVEILKTQNDSSESNHDSGIERLPDEHVSIVETTDDREIVRPVGTTRRKLYFNPAYFEPHLMAEPPAAALEFLEKIREVISIAKHKMASKRFQPILNEIPEEETYPSNGNSLDVYQGLGSQRSGSVISLKRENSRKRSISCMGCPGCKSGNNIDIQNFLKHNVPTCSNCMHSKGDKQNSIRKWLENIPNEKQDAYYNDFVSNANHHLANSLSSLPTSGSRCSRMKKQNYSNSNSFNMLDSFSAPERSSNMSVRSEPPLRNYNLPLPDFNHKHTSYNYHCQMISKVDEVTPKGFGDYRPRSGSLGNHSINDHGKNKFINSKNILPDMVNEAVALEHCTTSYNHSSSDDERVANNKLNALSKSSYSRNHSESPQLNDYETDSLERTSNKKRQTPTDYSDVPSSQASPSLSNALPLEEELTMRNAIYKTASSSSNTPSPQRDIYIDQNHYESIGKNKALPRPQTEPVKPNENKDYSLVSEVYVNNNYNFGSTPTSPSSSECSMGSRKLAVLENMSEAKPGCLTIEVKDSPENYIKIHESDGFEPDTLDRKHPKNQEVVEATQFSRKQFIKNIERNASPCPIPRKELLSNSVEKDRSKHPARRNGFNESSSICDSSDISTYAFKTPDETGEESWDEDAPEWVTEEGRILTLELRHSKRQRQCTPLNHKLLRGLPRPDILPPLPPTDDVPIYEQPTIPPRRVEISKFQTDNTPKNLCGRSLSPRSSMKRSTIEALTSKNIPEKLHHGHTCSPLRASVQQKSSEILRGNASKHGEISGVNRNSSRKSSGKMCEINTNTFVKSQKDEGVARIRMRRKKGAIEDSGYLSSDSAGSRQISRKLIVAKLASCSESEDTENEARSESGAESVETHSVYFGSFRQNPNNDMDTSIRKSIRASGRTFKHLKDCV